MCVYMYSCVCTCVHVCVSRGTAAQLNCHSPRVGVQHTHFLFAYIVGLDYSTSTSTSIQVSTSTSGSVSEWSSGNGSGGSGVVVAVAVSVGVPHMVEELIARWKHFQAVTAHQRHGGRREVTAWDS